MTIETLTKEVTDLRRKMDLAETKLSQQAGQFEFISGQLRDVQLCMHARFSDLDENLSDIKAQLDALPRLIAEMIAKK